MAGFLAWKEGEGYDVHVLRGASSKALDKSLKLDPNAGPPTFTAHFKGAPKNFGLDVDPATGSVTAKIQPSDPQPKFPNFNFLITAAQGVGASALETVIRIHVHDSIKKIWLTPSSLTIHESCDECRFTVLALFNDDTVGDITEWPELTYTSSPPPPANAVRVFNRGEMFHNRHTDKEEEQIFGGRLHGQVLPEGIDSEGDVTVTLNLTSPPPATAKVFVKPSWTDVAKDPNTKVTFVGGPQVPNENNFNSLASVVASRPNILFISEGFKSKQEDDFRKKVVELTVKELQTNPTHEPFKLLKGSINYWSVFVPSIEEGTSILGENAIVGKSPKQSASPVPVPVPPAQSQWTIENMIHQAGLPLPRDKPVASPAAWPASRATLFDIPTSVSVNKTALSEWNDLKQRTLLNERDSAFGIANYDRPRASGQGLIDAEELLQHDPRRTSAESIEEFLQDLLFSGFPIRSPWVNSLGPQPDFGRVCFVCRSGRTGGTAVTKIGGTVPLYFTAATGQASGANVAPAASPALGIDVQARHIDKKFSITLYASVVAHECGHALGLGDEYGADATFQANPPTEPNLQPDTFVAPANPNTGLRTFDVDKIKWLWPRISKAGVLVGDPDFQGQADPPQFLVHLRKGDGKVFGIGDFVRIRHSPLKGPQSGDPFADIALKIDQNVTSDDVSVTYMNQSGPHLVLNQIDRSRKLILICTRIKSGIDIPLVAPPILNYIKTHNLPLNAPKGSHDGAACVLGGGAVTSPTNLPKLSKGPPTRADIIGLYEGGGHFDCGVFRPAGRCKMQTGLDDTIPFCHVCRYVIVDTLDPAKHGDLESKLYENIYPA